MKILIDTNVLLDVLQKRDPWCAEAQAIFHACEDGLVEGSISALSVMNLVYIMRKELSPDRILHVLELLDSYFSIEDVLHSDLLCAAKRPFKDYEDAVHVACAQRIGAVYVVTRNLRDFANSPVRAVEPAQFLQHL